MKCNRIAFGAVTSLGLLVGCQGSFPNVSGASRVPPPPVGSFQAPTNYSGSTATGPATPTLGQLRSMESGTTSQPRIEESDVASLSTSSGSFTPRAVNTAAVASPLNDFPMSDSAVQPASAFSAR
jgi:hypothetical protein